MSKKSLLYLTYTGVFAALIFVLTYTVKINIANGYYHVGDAAIFLAASCLPLPYAAAASALGAGLADLVSGYAIYAVPTMIIKSGMICLMNCRHSGIVCKRNLAGLILSLFISVGGYYLAEVLLITRSFEASLISIWGNLVQFSVSAVIYVIIGLTFDKLKLRNKIFGKIWQC